MTAATWEQTRSHFSLDFLARFTAKRLARAADTHPKTADRWRRGEAAPSGEALLRMMSRDDEIFAAILAAAGRATAAAQTRAIAHLERALAALEAA